MFHPLTVGHHTNTQTRERADYIRALDADGRLSAAVSWTRLENLTLAWWHRRVLRVRADEQAGAPGESGEGESGESVVSGARELYLCIYSDSYET